MELINEVDDLDNKNIEINNPSDISSTSSQETGIKSNAVQNFISGFKNFLKPKYFEEDLLNYYNLNLIQLNFDNFQKYQQFL